MRHGNCDKENTMAVIVENAVQMVSMRFIVRLDRNELLKDLVRRHGMVEAKAI